MQAVPGLSVGFQAGSAMFDAVAQSNMYRGAAGADRENARLALLQGAYGETDALRRGRAVQGEAIAAGAENTGGVAGSTKDVIFQNALDIERTVLATRFSASTEARGYTVRAAQEKAAARNAIFGGILRAGAAAVTGIQDAYNQNHEDAAYQRRYQAYYPGGQQLPMPAGGPVAPPSFAGPRY